MTLLHPSFCIQDLVIFQTNCRGLEFLEKDC